MFDALDLKPPAMHLPFEQYCQYAHVAVHLELAWQVCREPIVPATVENNCWMQKGLPVTSLQSELTEQNSEIRKIF